MSQSPLTRPKKQTTSPVFISDLELALVRHLLRVTALSPSLVPWSWIHWLRLHTELITESQGESSWLSFKENQAKLLRSNQSQTHAKKSNSTRVFLQPNLFYYIREKTEHVPKTTETFAPSSHHAGVRWPLRVFALAPLFELWTEVHKIRNEP